jgi:endonuclease/exonuclease/phosphatase (EEP) superfamily protein YafD
MLPWWPQINAAIIPKYILLFGPNWWLICFVLILAFFWRCFTKTQFFVYPILVILSFNYLDFQLPATYSNVISTPNDPQIKLKVITFNMGNSSFNGLKSLVKDMDPDILFLQEAGNIKLHELFDSDYFSDCVSGLCILSKYPFRQEKTLDRNLFGAWGKFAVFYTVFTPNKELALVNIHLETPRPILTNLFHLNLDQKLAEDIESKREFEASLINLWSYKRKNALVLGDFNMRSKENLYRVNFNFLNNAVEEKGSVFNWTKYTSWHAIRIDHILYSDEFIISSVEVLNFKEGDHRPLMAVFII